MSAASASRRKCAYFGSCVSKNASLYVSVYPAPCIADMCRTAGACCGGRAAEKLIQFFANQPLNGDICDDVSVESGGCHNRIRLDGLVDEAGVGGGVSGLELLDELELSRVGDDLRVLRTRLQHL